MNETSRFTLNSGCSSRNLDTISRVSTSNRSSSVLAINHGFGSLAGSTSFRISIISGTTSSISCFSRETSRSELSQRYLRPGLSNRSKISWITLSGIFEPSRCLFHSSATVTGVETWIMANPQAGRSLPIAGMRLSLHMVIMVEKDLPFYALKAPRPQ